MPIPTYTLGYPPDGSSLGQTKATIRNNLDGTFETLGIDHINNNGQPGSQPAGYHNVIHMVPQGSDPAAVTGYGQLYSKTIVSDVTTDQALFWETGGGLIQQLTVNLTPSASTNGYTYLPGGLILQWGSAASTSSSTPNCTVVFATANIKFPNACFNVQCTVNQTSTNRNSVVVFSKSNTQFQATGIDSSGNAASGIVFYWVAIGN